MAGVKFFSHYFITRLCDTIFIAKLPFVLYRSHMATPNQTKTAPAKPGAAPENAAARLLRGRVMDSVRGTTKISEILWGFGAIRAKGTTDCKLSFTIKECKASMVLPPAAARDADYIAVASDCDAEILRAAAAIRERLKPAAAAAARKRIGDDKIERWSVVVDVSCD